MLKSTQAEYCMRRRSCDSIEKWQPALMLFLFLFYRNLQNISWSLICAESCNLFLAVSSPKKKAVLYIKIGKDNRNPPFRHRFIASSKSRRKIVSKIFKGTVSPTDNWL